MTRPHPLSCEEGVAWVWPHSQSIIPRFQYWGFQVACPRSDSNFCPCTLVRECTMYVFTVYTA